MSTFREVIHFSFIGYTIQAEPDGDQTTLDVAMAPEVTSLDEIVVTAYATQKKKDLTGIVGVINTGNSDYIESFAVVKDAGAASNYGAKVSNGVAFITTKQGNAAKHKIM